MGDHRELIEPMEFFKIDRISDEVYNIGPNLSLKFNVSLSRTANDKRYHFHKEFEYPSRTDDVPSLVTIKRSFDYFFTIENNMKDNNGNKVYIRIGPSEFVLLQQKLQEVISWFTDKKYEKLFAKNKGELIIMPPIPSAVVDRLPMQKYIEFMPTIIDRGMAKDDKEPGVRMVYGEGQSLNLTIDRLMGLYCILTNFNMYQAALELVNYLGRPEFGANRFVIDQPARTIRETPNNTSKTGATGIIGRFPQPKGNDDIKLLEG